MRPTTVGFLLLLGLIILIVVSVIIFVFKQTVLFIDDDVKEMKFCWTTGVVKLPMVRNGTNSSFFTRFSGFYKNRSITDASSSSKNISPEVCMLTTQLNWHTGPIVKKYILRKKVLQCDQENVVSKLVYKGCAAFIYILALFAGIAVFAAAYKAGYINCRPKDSDDFHRRLQEALRELNQRLKELEERIVNHSCCQDDFSGIETSSNKINFVDDSILGKQRNQNAISDNLTEVMINQANTNDQNSIDLDKELDKFDKIEQEITVEDTIEDTHINTDLEETTDPEHLGESLARMEESNKEEEELDEISTMFQEEIIDEKYSREKLLEEAFEEMLEEEDFREKSMPETYENKLKESDLDESVLVDQIKEKSEQEILDGLSSVEDKIEEKYSDDEPPKKLSVVVVENIWDQTSPETQQIEMNENDVKEHLNYLEESKNKILWDIEFPTTKSTSDMSFMTNENKNQIKIIYTSNDMKCKVKTKLENLNENSQVTDKIEENHSENRSPEKSSNVIEKDIWDQNSLETQHIEMNEGDIKEDLQNLEETDNEIIWDIESPTIPKPPEILLAIGEDEEIFETIYTGDEIKFKVKPRQEISDENSRMVDELEEKDSRKRSLEKFSETAEENVWRENITRTQQIEMAEDVVKDNLKAIINETLWDIECPAVPSSDKLFTMAKNEFKVIYIDDDTKLKTDIMDEKKLIKEAPAITNKMADYVNENKELSSAPGPEILSDKITKRKKQPNIYNIFRDLETKEMEINENIKHTSQERKIRKFAIRIPNEGKILKKTGGKAKTKYHKMKYSGKKFYGFAVTNAEEMKRPLCNIRYKSPKDIT